MKRYSPAHANRLRAPPGPGERDHPIGRRDNGVAMAHGGYGIKFS